MKIDRCDSFPFTESEWASVAEAAVAIVNASSMDDVAQSIVAHGDLDEVLRRLGECYGEHPVLIETAADFATDENERARLHRRVLQIAEAEGLETGSLVTALERVLGATLSRSPM